MRLTSKLTPLAVAVSMGVAGLSAPTAANAEMSASFAASNMYLWRGKNISNPSPAISGSLDYSHESGAYAGIWGSSEGKFDNSSEYDLYVGFAGEAGDFSYDLMVVEYIYPYDPGDTEITFDFGETIVSVGFGGLSASVYFSNQDSDTQYVTVGYGWDKFGVTFGTWMLENANSEYSHVDFSYAATDELSFTFSQIVDEEEPGAEFTELDGADNDMLFAVTYSKSFDL